MLFWFWSNRTDIIFRVSLSMTKETHMILYKSSGRHSFYPFDLQPAGCGWDLIRGWEQHELIRSVWCHSPIFKIESIDITTQCLCDQWTVHTKNKPITYTVFLYQGFHFVSLDLFIRAPTKNQRNCPTAGTVKVVAGGKHVFTRTKWLVYIYRWCE